MTIEESGDLTTFGDGKDGVLGHGTYENEKTPWVIDFFV